MFKRKPVVLSILAIFGLVVEGQAATQNDAKATPPLCDTPIPPTVNDKPIKSSVTKTAKTPTSQQQKLSSADFEAFTGKVLGNKVRLRTQPDLDGKVIRELNKGDLLIITSEVNGYFAVKPPKGTKAFVFRSYILDNVVEGSRVNVRLEPSLEAPVIGQLTGGEKINGTISSTNSKWLEIEPPTTTKFYVAKDYIQSIGTPAVFESAQKRKSEVDSLLDKAYVTSQAELKKPFDQISLEQMYRQFNHIIQDFADYPDQVAKAKEAMDLVQRTYLQKQIAFLESKTQQTTENYEAKQASINAEVEGYQKRLAELEEQLNKERQNSNQIAAIPIEAPHEIQIPAKQNLSAQTQLQYPINQNDTFAPNIIQSPQDMTAPSSPNADITAQMGYWVQIEDSYYKKWLRNNPPKPIDAFYKAEEVKAVTLQGTIVHYSHTIKNRPGDYILKVNNLPVAYLYSTKINLNNKLGQSVKVIAIPRPNNSFAYPAYFVLTVE